MGDGLADSLLTQVYETNHIDCVMQHAECQATLNDVCALQIKCTNDKDKPVDLQLWGGDEFTVFTDPEDPRQAFAVVTIDRYNQRTRYKLWFEDEVRTYLTDQYSADKTAGAGRDPGEERGEEYLWMHPFCFPSLSSSGTTVLDAWTRIVLAQGGATSQRSTQ